MSLRVSFHRSINITQLPIPQTVHLNNKQCTGRAIQEKSTLMSQVQIFQILTYVLSQSIMSNSLQPHGLQPARVLCVWNFPGKNTEVGCQFLLQVIFPTQEMLYHCATRKPLTNTCFEPNESVSSSPLCRNGLNVLENWTHQQQHPSLGLTFAKLA